MAADDTTVATPGTTSEFAATPQGSSWTPPEAGLIGLARLGNNLDGGFVAKRLLEPPYKTFLLPGSAYDQPSHIRMGVGGGAEANLALGLSRLSAFLNAQN